MKKIRLLLIEDNSFLREGIIALLNEQQDIEIISSPLNGSQNILKLHKLKPQVILLDLGLRNMNSLNMVKVLKKEFPDTNIIIMDLTPLQGDILQYVKAGASGFILKDATFNDFFFTIKAVAEGTKVLPPLMVDSLFSQIVEYALKSGKPGIKKAVKLTKREKEIIALIGDGLTNKEIGQKIHVSVYTIKSHVHNIMEKLVLHSRLEVANYSYTDETLRTIAKSISNVED